MGLARTAGGGALAVLALALTAVPAHAADPALAALRASDAYASPRALGPAAPQAEDELSTAAARLADEGRPAKLAVVAGPVGAPSMRAYARRLARALDYRGTLVVTAPQRPVIAVGPVPPATITQGLRAEGVAAVADPVDRVVRAAQVAAPPSAEEEGSGTREILILLGLAALGAAWALAWGSRRDARRQRERMLEARAAAIVRLDAVGARAEALSENRALTPAARADVERARAAHAQVAAALRDARSVADVERVAPEVHAALAALARAGASVGEDQPADDPFAGLCGVDPAHGPAAEVAETADPGDAVAVCAGCRDEAAAGRPPHRRLIPVGGRPVPFTEVDHGPVDGPG
jgi:hypothetical protein